MVEINVNPIPAQVAQPQTSNAVQNTGGLPPIGINNAPDSVIAPTTQSNESNVRGEDAFRQQRRAADGDRGAIPSIGDLSIGVNTRVAFDQEKSGRVVLEIKSNSGQAIARIPSESLVQYLESQFRQDNNVSTLADGERNLP